MKLTEKEAGRALQSLDVLRSELYQFQQFRDELEITHLKGLDDTFAGAKVVISQKENRTFSLNMPYEFLMKWVLENIEKLEKAVKELEDKFSPKTDEDE